MFHSVLAALVITFTKHSTLGLGAIVVYCAISVLPLRKKMNIKYSPTPLGDII